MRRRREQLIDVLPVTNMESTRLTLTLPSQAEGSGIKRYSIIPTHKILLDYIRDAPPPRSLANCRKRGADRQLLGKGKRSFENENAGYDRPAAARAGRLTMQVQEIVRRNLNLY